MALPPERIRIKRRREEEPVETLYIESNAVQHSKRRLTEFAFQRVVRNEDGTIVVGSPGPKPPAQPQPHFPWGPSVPLVRATKPGAEFEDTRRAKQLITNNNSGKLPFTPIETRDVGHNAALSRNHPGMRRFHLESLDFDDSVTPPHDSSGSPSGVAKKRRLIKPMRRIVIVERKPGDEGTTSTRVVPALDDLASLIGDIRVSNNFISKAQEEARSVLPLTPRKRHVINAAEKRWKEEKVRQSAASSTSRPLDLKQPTRTGDSVKDDPSTWNQNSDELADELAQIAMQLTGDFPIPSPKPTKMELPSHPTIEPQAPKPRLKYQPRLPQTPRKRPSAVSEGPEKLAGRSNLVGGDTMDIDSAPAPDSYDGRPSSSGTDAGYVYDEFIRRPLHEIEIGSANLNGPDVPRDVGLICITEEDAHQWAEVLEDEEDSWDDEDEDSNAEDNPANDYPDEDLDFDDEFDDANAAYCRFRYNASDDEEFDVNDYNEYGYQGDDSDEDGMQY